MQSLTEHKHDENRRKQLPHTQMISFLKAFKETAKHTAD